MQQKQDTHVGTGVGRRGWKEGRRRWKRSSSSYRKKRQAHEEKKGNREDQRMDRLKRGGGVCNLYSFSPAQSRPSHTVRWLTLYRHHHHTRGVHRIYFGTHVPVITAAPSIFLLPVRAYCRPHYGKFDWLTIWRMDTLAPRRNIIYYTPFAISSSSSSFNFD
jgi:hypothetical protein